MSSLKEVNTELVEFTGLGLKGTGDGKLVKELFWGFDPFGSKGNEGTHWTRHSRRRLSV